MIEHTLPSDHPLAGGEPNPELSAEEMAQMDQESLENISKEDIAVSLKLPLDASWKMIKDRIDILSEKNPSSKKEYPN